MYSLLDFDIFFFFMWTCRKLTDSVDSEVMGKADESDLILENTARIHGQTEAAACLTASKQLSCLLWLHPACCRVEGGCCPWNCAVGPRASSVDEWQPPAAAPWLIFAWASYLYPLLTPAPLTLGGRHRPGPSEPGWRSVRLATVTQLSWPMIFGRSKCQRNSSRIWTFTKM